LRIFFWGQRLADKLRVDVSVSLVVVNVSLEVRLVSRQEDGGGGGGRDDTCKLLLHIGQPASESTGKEVACVCVCVSVCVYMYTDTCNIYIHSFDCCGA